MMASIVIAPVRRLPRRRFALVEKIRRLTSVLRGLLERLAPRYPVRESPPPEWFKYPPR